MGTKHTPFKKRATFVFSSDGYALDLENLHFAIYGTHLILDFLRAHAICLDPLNVLRSPS